MVRFILINHNAKVIFIHPCRCAGTSIEVLFGCNTDQLNASGEGHALPDFYSKKYWQQYASFISVRNPYDRLLSAFKLIKEKDLPAYRPYVKDYDLDSFNQFVVDFISREEIWANDRMFWPQSKWLYRSNKRIKYSKIIRFESLLEDANKLLKIIGKSKQDLPHLLKTKSMDYRDVYNRDAIEVVSHIYRKDLEILGYSF